MSKRVKILEKTVKKAGITPPGSEIIIPLGPAQQTDEQEA